MNDNTLLIQVLDFAFEAHKGQERKFTGEPYIFHPIEVAQIVSTVNDDPEVIAAAILHDTVEDTDATDEDIRTKFGDRVADLVAEVTKATMNSKEDRGIRKELDRQHYAAGSSDGHDIKLADVLSNTSDVHLRSPEFAKVYVLEQEALVNSLIKGNVSLRVAASDMIKKVKSELNIH